MTMIARIRPIACMRAAVISTIALTIVLEREAVKASVCGRRLS